MKNVHTREKVGVTFIKSNLTPVKKVLFYFIKDFMRLFLKRIINSES